MAGSPSGEKNGSLAPSVPGMGTASFWSRIQGGQHLGLALELRHVCWIAGEGLRENFERHVALQLCVTSAMDLAHAPDAEQRLSFVGAKPGSYWERHKG